MAGEIIRQGDPTSHNGKVLEGSLVDICHGKPIAFIGHKVFCPQCKGTFPIVEGCITTTFYGKGVALAGMKTACGATLIATQFTDIVEVATGSGARTGSGGADSVKRAAAVATGAALIAASRGTAGSPVDQSDSAKKVTRLFWSYGDDETVVTDKSRHYVDLNLHIETENYAPGETVEVLVENDAGVDVITGTETLRLTATVGSDGTAKAKNVFAGKTVDITDTA